MLYHLYCPQSLWLHSPRTLNDLEWSQSCLRRDQHLSLPGPRTQGTSRPNLSVPEFRVFRRRSMTNSLTKNKKQKLKTGGNKKSFTSIRPTEVLLDRVNHSSTVPESYKEDNWRTVVMTWDPDTVTPFDVDVGVVSFDSSTCSRSQEPEVLPYSPFKVVHPLTSSGRIFSLGRSPTP